MSYIQFTNNIILKQVLIDDKDKTLEQMVDQIQNPTKTLVIKSMFTYPDLGRLQYINPRLTSFCYTVET